MNPTNPNPNNTNNNTHLLDAVCRRGVLVATSVRYWRGCKRLNLCDLITGHHTRLTDVLRHEWAHALADRRPRLVEGKRFRNVFGADYHSPHPVWEHHPDLHLTRYAAAMPCEDYAESLVTASADANSSVAARVLFFMDGQ